MRRSYDARRRGPGVLVAGMLWAATTGCGLMESLTPLEPAPRLAPDEHTQARAEPVAPLPRALFVLGGDGTEIFDLLAPYEVLAASGAFSVATVAGTRSPVPLTGRLAVVPDHTFDDAPEADVIVVPAIASPEDEAVVGFVRRRGARAGLVLSVCEGARVVARSGLLDGGTAATHFAAVDALDEAYQATRFVHGHRYVWSPPVLSTAGVSAALDGSLAALALRVGDDAARETAEQLGIRWHRETDTAGASARAPAHEIGLGDAWRLVTSYLQPWRRSGVALWLRDGSSEIAIAAVLDALPRTLRVAVTSVAGARRVVTTRHGLRLIANETWAELGDRPLDRVFAVGPAPVDRSPRGDAVQPIGVPTPGAALDEVLAVVADEISPGHRRTVGAMLEYADAGAPGP